MQISCILATYSGAVAWSPQTFLVEAHSFRATVDHGIGTEVLEMPHTSRTCAILGEGRSTANQNTKCISDTRDMCIRIIE